MLCNREHVLALSTEPQRTNSLDSSKHWQNQVTLVWADLQQNFCLSSWFLSGNSDSPILILKVFFAKLISFLFPVYSCTLPELLKTLLEIEEQDSSYKGLTLQATSNKLCFCWCDWMKACMSNVWLPGSARSAWKRIFHFYSPKLLTQKHRLGILTKTQDFPPLALWKRHIL